MEQLTKEHQKQIKRMSTSRIWHQLFKAGYDKVDLESLSRQELMNKLAEDLLWESFTFWWKLCEQKQLQIRETHTVQLKQYLVKVGYNEEWIRNKPRIVVMEIMAEVKLAEEEQDEERRRQDEERRRQDEEKRRREEKREQEEKEEKRKREQEEKEEKRRLEEEKRRREEKREQEEIEEKQNKEYAEKEEAKRQEDLAIENKKIELAQEQLREERQSREAAERRRNEEREIERLRQAENDSL